MLEPARLSALQPDQVAAYLVAQGWLAGRQSELLHSFAKVADGHVVGHVAVPQKHGLEDFGQIMALAIKRFAEVEDRVPSEILEDIGTVNFDTVRVRLVGGSFDKGRIRLADASDMVTGVRDLFFAGAATLERRQAVFQGRSTGQVGKYINSLEIAAPEKGSFVVKVLSPLPIDLTRFGATYRPGEEPFGRKATASMLNAVEATIDAAKEAKSRGNVEVFKDHVKEGVSANICEAITAISGESAVTSVAVGATWSRMRPMAPQERNRALVPSELVALIQRAAPMLRGRRPDDPVTVVGIVFMLKEDKNDAAQAVGIKNMESKGPRKVRVTLRPEQYRDAIEAHGKDFLVRVTGVVKQRGPFSYIEQPSSFEALGAHAPGDMVGPPEYRRDITSFEDD